MRIMQGNQLKKKDTEKEWYVVSNEDEILAGPFIYFGDALKKRKQIEKGEL